MAKSTTKKAATTKGRRHKGQVLVRLLEADHKLVLTKAKARDESASQWVRALIRRELYALDLGA